MQLAVLDCWRWAILQTSDSGSVRYYGTQAPDSFKLRGSDRQSSTSRRNEANTAHMQQCLLCQFCSMLMASEGTAARVLTA